MLAETAAEPRAKEAAQVTGDRAETCLPMGLPAAFRLDHLVPGPHAGLDGPAPIRQGRASTAHGGGGESPVGKRRADGAATEEEAPRDQRPEQPEQTQIRADGHVGSDRTQQESHTVDYGRHRANLPAYRV